MHIPRLYPILDASCFPDAESLCTAAEELAAAGIALLQYRNKSGNARQMLDHARELKHRVGSRVTLIMNDRADLCLAADFDGLHVGQDDLSPEAARRIIGSDSMASRAGSASPRTIPNSSPKPIKPPPTIWPLAQSSPHQAKRIPTRSWA